VSPRPRACCAHHIPSAFGTLVDGDDVRAQAAKVGDQLKGIMSQCQAALGAS